LGYAACQPTAGTGLQPLAGAYIAPAKGWQVAYPKTIQLVDGGPWEGSVWVRHHVLAKIDPNKLDSTVLFRWSICRFFMVVNTVRKTKRKETITEMFLLWKGKTSFLLQKKSLFHRKEDFLYQCGT